MKSRSLLISSLLFVAGITSLILGAIKYNSHPQMAVARHIMWEATKLAKVEYILAFVFLFSAYFLLNRTK